MTYMLHEFYAKLFVFLTVIHDVFDMFIFDALRE